MSGFIQDPLQIINLIADNIRDRYKTGFSVIKEIIQNAEDANIQESEGVHIEFGLTQGIQGADNILLKGPALFFINDGRFTESDDTAIRSFGLNRKAIDEATIGKFGLGMKSVFHFCEAFFFLAKNSERSYFRILNPWSGGKEFHSIHNDWDDFTENDTDKIKAHLETVLSPINKNRDSWFLLWLPLRMKKHLNVNGREVGSIVAEFHGDNPNRLAFLNRPDMPMRLAGFLPLLRRVEQIRYWVFDQSTGNLQSNFTVGTDTGAVRLKYPEKPAKPGFNGNIIITKEGNESVKHKLIYTGKEAFLKDPQLEELRASAYWPKSYVRNDDGISQQAPDKAKGHCAAVFASYNTSSGNGRLKIRWNVFLPVDTGKEIISCEGNLSFDLNLHGYFFVDAGRTEIDGIEQNSEALSGYDPGNESELRRIWNGTLVKLGTLPLVLPALVEFARQSRLHRTAFSDLCTALKDSKMFLKYRSSVCHSHQLIFKLAPKGLQVRLEPKNSSLLPLPDPPASDPSRPWKTFRKLETLRNMFCLLRSGAPHLLASQINPKWDESQLLQLLDIDEQAIFNDQGLLDYLHQFLHDQHVISATRSIKVQKRLCEILKSAFIKFGESLNRHRAKIQGIISLINPGFRLPVTGTWSDTLGKLLACTTEALVLPKNMDAPNYPGKAVLSLTDAVILLEKIDELFKLYNMGNNDNGLDDCRTFSSQIIEGVSSDGIPELLNRCQDLSVLEGYDCNGEKRVLFSINDLEASREKGLLFLYSQGTNDKQRLGLSLILQKAIKFRAILINSKLASRVFGESHELVSCDADGCLRTLGNTALILGNEDRRSILLQHLTGAKINHPALIRGMRYLLHGRADRFEDEGPLWTRGYQQSRAWEKMWQNLTNIGDDDWSLINRSLIENIPAGRWNNLNIREIKPAAILSEYREIGFDSVEPESFSQDERNEILIAAGNDKSLWQMLPFHQTLTGKNVSILQQDSFLESDIQLPTELQSSINIICRSGNERVRHKQDLYIKPLNDLNLIRIILGHHRPNQYWKEIMDALQRMGAENRKIVNIQEDLCNSKWLIDQEGTPICPADVLHLKEIEDELCRLVAIIPGVFRVPTALDANIQKHPFFNDLKEKFFSKNEEGLEKLGLLIGESQQHFIGHVRCDADKLELLINVLKNIPTELSLPGWNLIGNVTQAFGVGKSEQFLLPEMSRPIQLNKVTALLDWLKERHINSNASSKKNIIAAYNTYLDVFVRSENSHRELHHLNLLNEEGQWRCATEICADAEGISPADMLDDSQKYVLRPIIETAGQYENNPYKSAPVIDADIYFSASKTAENLEALFTGWDQIIAPEIVCAFLCLIGNDKDVLKLAERFHGSHSIEWVRDNLPWKTNYEKDTDHRQGWLYGMDQHQAIEKHRFIIETVAGNTAKVVSLTEKTIEVRLNEDFESLLVGELWYEKPRDDTIFPKICLRKLDTEKYSPEQLTTYLRATAEYLLKNAYDQQNCNLESLWDQLDESEQLDIKIAQRLVMKHIPYYLRQLGVHKHPELSHFIRKWDDARYRVEEYSEKPEKQRDYEKKEQEALRQLQDLIKSNTDVQQTVLDAVRSKVNDYQYTPESILLELFQNADDAVAELELIKAYPENQIDSNNDLLPMAARRFVVSKDPKSLSIMHWGRPINYIGSGGFPGRDRGFHQDLEKMLVLSASDKVGVQTSTGKFGLGFKSTFLVSNVPRFISGRLAVEIIAGLLPKKLDNAKNLKLLLQEETTGERLTGTIIELPLDKCGLEELYGSFENIAGVLPVFAKKLRRIEMKDSDGNKLSKEWTPEILAKTPGVNIEFGILNLDNRSHSYRTEAVHFREKGGGGLLVGMGPHGFRALPGNIPGIWVVAPTQEESGFGFAVNGNFEVDAGRARLSSNSEINKKESERIGRLIGEGLILLFDEAKDDWNNFTKRLRLESGVNPYGFWESVWQVLTGSWNNRPDSKVAKLIEYMLANESGLGKIISNREALPSGLDGRYQRLTMPKSVQFTTQGIIDKKMDILEQISRWESFSSKIIPGKIVSHSRAWQVVRRLIPDKWRPRSLNLSEIIQWELDEDQVITPEKAAYIGKTISRDLLAILAKDTADIRQENEDLKNILKHIRFMTKDRRFLPANERGFLVLDKNLTDDEETLRAQFAPDEKILSPDYDLKGVQFFKTCRSQMDAPSEMLHEWALNAKDKRKRTYLLKYLLYGELGRSVGGRLRQELPGWLKEIKTPIFFQNYEFEEHEQLQLLGILGFQRKDLENDIPSEPAPTYNPGYILKSIFQWWKNTEKQQTRKYEKLIYVGGRFPKIDEDGPKNLTEKGEWIKLFLHGVLHSIGRAQEGANKNFIKKCNDRGWLSHLANADTQPHLWLKTFDEYIDEQIQDIKFYHWMKQLIGLFIISRRLNEYVDAFLAINHIKDPFSLNQITRPRASEIFQGGGPDAPPISGILGMGAWFIMRELVRKGVIKNEHAHQHCYVPVKRVRGIIQRLNGPSLENLSREEQSIQTYNFIVDHLGAENATFHNSFDIPLQVIAMDGLLQLKFFHENIPIDELEGEEE